MSTSPIARLEWGTKSLNLNDLDRFFIGEDLTPPAVAIVPQYASGTSANRTGGSRLVGQRATDREFSFTVTINAGAGVNSDAKINRATRDIRAMLDHAGDVAEPLYFVYRSNSDTPEPLWGNYGTNLRYEVLRGEVTLPGDYLVGLNFTNIIDATIRLTVKPYAIGKRQRLASATGGVLEDTIGTVDGISRGTIIAENTTNKMTNPVFGHATALNGWTTGADLASSQITDERYVLFGQAAAKLTNDTVTPVDRRFYQSINVGNTNTHVLSCYVKLPDGSAVSTSQVLLVYSSNIASGDHAFEAVGDGWYRVYANVTGINAATVTGILVLHPYTVYVDGFQIEERTNITPLAYGDLLGNAWSGTAHASTTTRTRAQMRLSLADILDIREGTIRIVWKSPYSNTEPNDLWFCQNAAGGVFRIYFEATGDLLNFSDGTNNATSAAQTFSPGDILVLHATFKPGVGLVLYKNGSSIATSATYTPPAAPGADLYIGTDVTPAFNNNGTFMDFATFDVALTSTQVLNDYTNIAQLVADDQRVGCVPWLWTKDGDNIVDNCNGSVSGTDRDNYCVCGGIPGSAVARTILKLASSANLADMDSIWLSLLPIDDFLDPAYLFSDLSGTADAGNSSGDAYETISVGTVDVSRSLTSIPRAGMALAGREAMAFLRANDVSTTLGLQVDVGYSVGGSAIVGDPRSRIGANAFRLYETYPVAFVNWGSVINQGLSLGTTFTFTVTMVRSSSSANVLLDYFQIMPRPLLQIDSTNVGAGSILKSVLVDGDTVQNFFTTSTSDIGDRNTSLRGDKIELEPEKYNVLISIVGDDTVNPVVTNTLTYIVAVYPRWGLL